MNFSISFFEVLNSTNRVLAEKVKFDIEEGIVISTDYQTAGRGQANNCWESERGKNLLFSFLIKPTNISASAQFVVSQIIALSIRDVLENYLEQQVTIKWPNDIYVQDKKIAGILIENSLQGTMLSTSIIGVGLNVNQDKFLSGAPNPISMKQLAEKEFDRNQVLFDVLQRFSFYYTDLTEQKRIEIAKLYKSKLYRNAGYHFFENEKKERFSAKIHDILPTGQLVLVRKFDNQPVIFSFKEVRFCI